ncbi:hypothetical protein K469DRAFT_647635 [Zopfia rhizophila CBS 207.26]|uniref:CUE domain-containing protein n=1 Tax=Zopfia rhizophila CBS 207.26 TaxID=1314779 RepID=A0A6A6D6N6_9PEZI|nr:hypothetical protein K469DRAFT_647635 [Zopfia rhizophila CBS 207.26]
MSLPPFAPFPQAELRRDILPQQWEVFLDSWVSLAELYLRLNDEEFSSILTEGSSLPNFLVSFFLELPQDENTALNLIPLRKKCFFLVHRIYSGDYIPPALLHWSFISSIGHTFSRSEHLRNLLRDLWARKGPNIENGLQVIKASLTKTLDSKNPGVAEDTLSKLFLLLKVSSDAGTFMLTGSDFLDSLCSAYIKVSPVLQKKLTTIAYLGLVSLVEGSRPNHSLLSDHLYSLKASAEQEKKSDPSKKTLLADLVTNTPLLNKIRARITSPEGARAKNIASSLSTFRQPTIVRPKNLVRRKVDKEKGKAKDDEYGHGAFGRVHVHRMSLVSQVQDLFTDLGSGFVVKLLDEYEDNVEQVTAHLLEDSLPPHLKNADRFEQILATSAVSKSPLTPRSTPPPQRRNVYNDDEFDKLAVETSRLHIGRKNEQLTADNLLSDRSGAPNKSAILAALAAFDSDDDERDDTYDVEDVGGTVDSAIPGAGEADTDLRDKNEEALFRAYLTIPELFERDAETQRGKVRAALKSETGMTDEAIEGWGVMIGRDPRRLRRLEAKFSVFSGQQKELASTAYRGSPADSGAEGEGEGSGDGQRGGRRGGFPGRGRGRGWGRGGGGRGSENVAGPPDDKGTQISRQRKEANKGSRANHNRRDQRAKKMARGGFPG